jgi:hypothetical protein
MIKMEMQACKRCKAVFYEFYSHCLDCGAPLDAPGSGTPIPAFVLGRHDIRPIKNDNPPPFIEVLEPDGSGIVRYEREQLEFWEGKERKSYYFYCSAYERKPTVFEVMNELIVSYIRYGRDSNDQ